jgi:uncharacterized protein YecE (DUF72 family)
MGYGYADWNGPFYPQGMPERNYLGYYATRFNAVELDTTFYGTPRLEVVQRWAAAAPAEFRFCLKMPRRITHELRLVNALEEMAEFLRAATVLGGRLGVVLAQFPPSFTAESMESLEAFLRGVSALPEMETAAGKVRLAVEFRHASWYTATHALAGMLREQQVAWAATEYPGLPRRITPTTGFLYLRWIGQHGSFEQHTYERLDRSQELSEWQQLVQAALPGIEELFGFFNNDYAGFAPASCQRFRLAAGLPAPPVEPPVQGRLF